MKNLLSVFGFFLFSQVCLAQVINIDSCGLDSKAYLNQCETNYFNNSLRNWRNDFDFKGKKIAFAYGNFGKTLISKKDYFDKWGKPYFNENSSVSNQLYILTSEEKATSGGYDAIIVAWSKVRLTEKNKKAIIKKLKK